MGDICLMLNDVILDHFQNPRNTGEIENADGIGQVGNASCGDVMKIYIRVVDDHLADVRYKTFGCATAIACSSVASEILIGRSVDEAEKLAPEEVAEVLGGLPEDKKDCSNLAPQAIRAAIKDYRSRQK